jgi:cytochrome c oxidase subunit 2
MAVNAGIEKRIVGAAGVFVLTLAGVIALSVRLFGIGLPTCLTDVRPFGEGKVIEQGPKRYEIHYVARMWKFEPAEISVLPGSTADIYLSTADVTHGMQITGTNINLMAIPGAVNYARVKFDRPGDYLVVCNEYCGVAHHNMAARIHVTEKATTPPPPPPAPVLAGGRKVIEDNGCIACHSLDGTPGVAGTLKGLYDRQRVLTNGSTVVADDAYIRESIESPDVKVVKGFEPIMPPLPLSPADIDAVIQYLKTLK